MATSVNVGDRVTTNAKTYWDGQSVASWVRDSTLYVRQVGIDGHTMERIVISTVPTGPVTGAVHVNTLTVVSSAGTPVQPPTTTPTPDVPVISEIDAQKMREEETRKSEAIEDALVQLMRNSNNSDVLKYNMRLHGIPNQFTQYCDYRSYSYMSDKPKYMQIGRKFIENIMIEAPVLTVIPGGPTYLPAAKKNRKGLSAALISAANGNISDLTASLSESDLKDKLRYYDFKQDYLTYIKYVNIMCAMTAAFLDIGDMEEARITSGNESKYLTQYLWQNYRWNDDDYTLASMNIVTAVGNKCKSVWTSFVNNIRAGIDIATSGSSTDVIKSIQNKLQGVGSSNAKSSVLPVFTDTEDKSFIESLEELLTQTNFVQFYIDPNSGVNESSENKTAESKLAGIFNTGQDMLKEAAFIGNSTGIDTTELVKALDKGVDTMNSKMFGGDGALSGVLNRILSSVNNVVKGENIIFPEIYQSSAFRKTYSVGIDLRAPYGNKVSYFMNVLVPLCHLLCLALPRQETANTYGSPFLIKAYYPGVFTCNLGIVESLTIDKSTSDGTTIDGFPTHIKVTLNIVDLYSDLTMSPSGDVGLFLSNSSLIEYLATSCGINLTTPQLQNRVTRVVTAIKASFNKDAISESIGEATFNSLESLITSFTGV